MVGRAPNEEKQARARIRGLMKKADELYRKYGIKTCLLAEDDYATTNPLTWSYQSIETFPSELRFNARFCFGPSDFMTVSEYRRGVSAQNLSAPKYDDVDVALLRAVRYPREQGSPRLKRRRSNSDTGDELVPRPQFQDPYNFRT